MYHRIAFVALFIIYSCNSNVSKEQKSEIQILSEKIVQNPKDLDLLYARVDYNKSKNNFEAALFDLKEIISLDSLNALHHYNISKLYFEISKGKISKPKYPSLV